MKLHQNPELFTTLIEAVRAATRIEAAFVEKDYWLTTVLWELSRLPQASIVVFKGGTSLSKAYGIIERFSEDVDFALLVDGLSGNQVKSRMDSISKGITRHLPEIHHPNITSKGSRFRRTAHQYPSTQMLEIETQMASEVVLEINAFANPHPFTLYPIQSMIGQLLESQSRQDVIEAYDLQPFTLQVLEPTRTLAEKVLALARASRDKQSPLRQLQNKIRHTYDLYCLLNLAEIQDFVASTDFFETLRAVQADDAKNSEFQGAWASEPLATAWIYQDDTALWDQLAPVYYTTFKPLVYGPLPSLEEVRKALHLLAQRLQVFDQT